MEAATAEIVDVKEAAKAGGPLNLVRSDEKLIERFQAGDEASFSAIYARHYGRVFAICLGVLSSRDDAQDAAQEVFATAATKLRANKTPQNFKPWLSQVARNAAIDIARSRKVTVEATEEHEITTEVGPGEVAAQRIELGQVMQGLKQLPEQQRSALVMREVGGYSYDEIAKTLELDEVAVRGLISRARLSLRTNRESQGLACTDIRTTLAEEVDGRRRPATIRRHLKSCSDCREFAAGLRTDQRVLRGIGAGLEVAGIASVIKFVVIGRPRGAAVAWIGKGSAVTKAAVGVGAVAVAGGAGAVVYKVENPSKSSKPQVVIEQSSGVVAPVTTQAVTTAEKPKKKKAKKKTATATTTQPQVTTQPTQAAKAAPVTTTQKTEAPKTTTSTPTQRSGPSVVEVPTTAPAATQPAPVTTTNVVTSTPVATGPVTEANPGSGGGKPVPKK